MNRSLWRLLAPAAALLAGLLLLRAPAESQAPAGAGEGRNFDPTAPAGTDRAEGKQAKGKAKSGPPGPVPKTAKGITDFSGIWSGGGSIGDIREGLPPGEELPLLPHAKALMDSRQSKDDPEANCLPTGVPRIAPYPWRIVQTDTHIFFLFEGNIHSYRQIFIDGRAFPADLDPTWYGYSIGRIEGNTLIVETRGFNDKFWFDFRGTPHTEQMTTIERYTRTDYGNLRVETTINDPGAYSRPFTVTFYATLRPGEELMEYICQENNQDVEHIVGPARL